MIDIICFIQKDNKAWERIIYLYHTAENMLGMMDSLIRYLKPILGQKI